MSLVYRQPLGFAWSIPGTVLLGPSLQHLSFAEVVGAFFVCGVLVLALGMSGLVRRVMAAIPMPIVMAMVAAVFLRFGTDIVASTQDNPVVAAPMVLAFILLTAVPALGRYLPPVLGTLVVGIVAVALSGQFALEDGGGPFFATPVFTSTASRFILASIAASIRRSKPFQPSGGRSRVSVKLTSGPPGSAPSRCSSWW